MTSKEVQRERQDTEESDQAHKPGNLSIGLDVRSNGTDNEGARYRACVWANIWRRYLNKGGSGKGTS